MHICEQAGGEGGSGGAVAGLRRHGGGLGAMGHRWIGFMPHVANVGAGGGREGSWAIFADGVHLSCQRGAPRVCGDVIHGPHWNGFMGTW